jgi:beta-galactosidase
VPAWPEAAGLSASDLRYRAPSESWLLAEGGGVEVGADGLLGRQRIGKGVVLWVQVDPRRFNADENTYLRFTRWRSTRALSQVLANLGASFKTDSLVFNPRSRSAGTVSLAEDGPRNGCSASLIWSSRDMPIRAPATAPKP